MNCKCKGVCETIEFQNTHDIRKNHRNAFKLGYSRCRTCLYFIKDFSHCPCCQTKLAIVSRNNESKRLLNSEIKRY